MSSRDRMRRKLIAYDIPSDRRRLWVARALEEFGDRVQYSVFVVDLLPSRFVQLTATLTDILDTKEDSILICDLGLTAALSDEQFSFLGRSRDVMEMGPVII
ncbi:CRISPR-associated endonuclease Cas2 [Micrococcus lylae]|uniref:CRISPR-associated endoribonuclease Cas2 n=1 Tax=Micrococcus lylae TaxID=1273 RepID=A0ABY2K1A4_9MICC|nr:CRISPR-associated endonuclease Cas2 [Micrococcus lylae]